MSATHLSEDAIVALTSAVMRDRIVGSLFGSALGDAIGLYTEFLSRDTSIYAYPARKFILSPSSEATPFRRDSHRSPNNPGDWTDDTDHAMLILLSYLHHNGQLKPQDFAFRLYIWVRMGLCALGTPPLGLGWTVGSIVRTGKYLEDPEGTSRRHWANSSYQIAPNGSLMRTHPLGLMCLSKSVNETFQVAADFSVVTHVDPRCIVSCAIGTALVRGLVRHDIYREEHIDELVQGAIAWYAAYRQRQLQDVSRRDEPDLDIAELERHVKAMDLEELELDDEHKIGYVYKTLGSGIHLLRLVLRQTASPDYTLQSNPFIFEPLITDLIMRGGDADTNACFAGALLGAHLGYAALPPVWRDGLRHGDWLMQKSEALCKVTGFAVGTYIGAQDKDTAPDGGKGFLANSQEKEPGSVLESWITQQEQKWKRNEK